MHKVAVRVLLFAKAREISGKKEDVVTVYSRISYSDLFEFIVRYFALEDIKSSLILAINEQYSDANIPLKLNDGDTIAIIPPLSGGSLLKLIFTHLMFEVKLSNVELSIDDIYKKAISDDCGAVSLFVGTTRDNFNDLRVKRLVYESYSEMAVKMMYNVCDEITRQWPEVRNIVMHHRLGEVPVGDASIVIAISSPHRNDSMDAVRFAINRIKAVVPIFKKEEYENGDAEWKQNNECSWSQNS